MTTITDTLGHTIEVSRYVTTAGERFRIEINDGEFSSVHLTAAGAADLCERLGDAIHGRAALFDAFCEGLSECPLCVEPAEPRDCRVIECPRKTGE